MNFDIEKLRKVVQGTTAKNWERCSKNEVLTDALIFQYKKRPEIGEYFLCDCIGNTIDLCLKTKKKYRVNGRLVSCQIIETLIPDCHKQFGTALNGVWLIPHYLL